MSDTQTVYVDPSTKALIRPTATDFYTANPPPSSGSGTVTSVGLTAPGLFSVTGSPVTGSGTLAIALANTPSGTSNTLLETNGSGSALTGLTAGQVSGLAASATTDTTNASNISSGTLSTSRLSTGSGSSNVAIGNDTRFPASVTGLRKGAGAGSSDVAATAGTDYLAPSGSGVSLTGTGGYSTGTVTASGTATALVPTGRSTYYKLTNVGGYSGLATIPISDTGCQAGDRFDLEIYWNGGSAAFAVVDQTSSANICNSASATSGLPVLYSIRFNGTAWFLAAVTPLDSRYAPASGSASYAPASGSTNYAGSGANTNITTLGSFYITSFISANAVVTTSSTTLTNSGLAVTLPTGTWDIYVQALFSTSGTTTTALKWAGVFSGTATDSGTWQMAANDSSSMSFGSFGSIQFNPLGSLGAYGLLGTSTQGLLAKGIMLRGRLVVTAAGTYNWQVSSNAAGTANVSILQGSLIQAFRAL